MVNPINVGSNGLVGQSSLDGVDAKDKLKNISSQLTDNDASNDGAAKDQLKELLDAVKAALATEEGKGAGADEDTKADLKSLRDGIEKAQAGSTNEDEAGKLNELFQQMQMATT